MALSRSSWFDSIQQKQQTAAGQAPVPSPSGSPIGEYTGSPRGPDGPRIIPDADFPGRAPTQPPRNDGFVPSAEDYSRRVLAQYPAGTMTAAPTSSRGPLTYDVFKQMRSGVAGTVEGLRGLESQLAAYGWRIDPNNPGNIIGPNGEKSDVLHNAGLGGEGWRQSGGWYGASSGGSGGGAASGIGHNVSGLASQTASPSSIGGSAFQSQVRSLLMDQLGKMSQPVSADDPYIRGEMDAQNRVLEQNRREQRATSAERAAFTGLNSGGQGSGALDTDIAAGFEAKGQQLSGLQAQLFSREMQSRRGQLGQMLAMAVQTGDNEAARALQLQIANMDAQLRKMGLAENARQFDDSFGLQGAQFRYLQDRDLANAGLGV